VNIIGVTVIAWSTMLLYYHHYHCSSHSYELDRDHTNFKQRHIF